MTEPTSTPDPEAWDQEQFEQERAEFRADFEANRDAREIEARHEQIQEEYQQDWAELGDQYDADHYEQDEASL